MWRATRISKPRSSPVRGDVAMAQSARPSPLLGGGVDRRWIQRDALVSAATGLARETIRRAGVSWSRARTGRPDPFAGAGGAAGRVGETDVHAAAFYEATEPVVPRTKGCAELDFFPAQEFPTCKEKGRKTAKRPLRPMNCAPLGWNGTCPNVEYVQIGCSKRRRASSWVAVLTKPASSE
jgi:hypothetical protein